MPNLTLRTFPDPILRVRAKPVESVSDVERELLAEMARIMYLKEGVGLAATQVGIDRQLIVIDIGTGLIKLINPSILKSEGTEWCDEGCLSVPGTCIKIKRAQKIIIEYLTEKGDVVSRGADGLLARAIQHEIDHLRGILIVDHIANPIKKLLLKKKIRRSRRTP